MIKSFRHRGLERFFQTGSLRGIQPHHASKLRMQLLALETATEVGDLDIPGYRLHPLKGTRRGVWSMVVSANWRLTFEFRNGDIHAVHYEDYH